MGVSQNRRNVHQNYGDCIFDKPEHNVIKADSLKGDHDMVGISIGVGLNSITLNQNASSSFENAVKASIEQRKHLTAVWAGTNVLLQPYALLDIDGTKVVLAVVVLAEGRAEGQWIPDTIPLAELSGVKVYDETFIPSDAFDPEILAGVVSVVEAFDPFQDASDSGTS